MHYYFFFLHRIAFIKNAIGLSSLCSQQLQIDLQLDFFLEFFQEID